jgi:hypothetical protein
LEFIAHRIRGTLIMLAGLHEDLWTCPDDAVETFKAALHRLEAIADTCSSAPLQSIGS